MLDLTKSYHPQTVAIRHGHERTFQQEHTEAIFATSSFVFDNAAQAAGRFSGTEEGNVYSRFTNPTVTNFEHRLGAMEEGEYCVAMASGMAAISSLVLTLLNAGDHVVCSSSLFGTSVSLFCKIFNRFGVETTFVDLASPEQWRNAIKKNTRLFFLESPSNPLCEIADIRVIAEIAHTSDILLTVDNAFCTPALQQPLKLGADIVVHSATKYLDGQGRCVGGAVVTNHKSIYQELIAIMRTSGPCLSPFNAWTFSKGLETLALRMMQHSKNALELAKWLQDQDVVNTVNYPGLSSHPQHELAKSQRNDVIQENDDQGVEGLGGVVSFDVLGGKQGAWNVIDSTSFLSITANLGDVKTTITHPATTTHGRISQAQRDEARISDGLIRVSVGLEYVGDIISDLKTGLDEIRNKYA
ncbi:MAG: O-succinylhomoserine sulfhydrylase [Gammaproteobacteria bacterium]|nr:O-succinylhomoserine sulfhydrylase [Gammaproteobacteria bacterium]